MIPSLDDAEKRKRLLELMRGSIQPAQTAVDDPSANVPMMRPLSRDPELPMPDKYPDWSQAITQPQSAPQRINVGVSTRGLQGVDKSIADLQAEEKAAKEFPSSKVVDGQVLPPKMYHGLGDRIKQGLKGLVIGMGDTARSDPDASAARILAGGVTGGAIGAASPQTADVLLQQARMPMRRAEVGQEIGLANEQAQMEARQAEPVLKAQQIQAEAEYRRAQAEQQARLEEGRDRRAAATEAGRASRAQARQQAEDARLAEEKRFHDLTTGQRGQETTKQAQDRQAKYRAAQQLLNDLGEQEKAAAKAKDDAWTDYQKVRQAHLDKGDENVDAWGDVLAARKKADDAQQYYASFWGKKNGAKADIERYRDLGDAAAPRGGRTWSLSKWLKANPNGDAEAARKAAQAKGYQVVE